MDAKERQQDRRHAGEDKQRGDKKKKVEKGEKMAEARGKKRDGEKSGKNRK